MGAQSPGAKTRAVQLLAKATTNCTSAPTSVSSVRNQTCLIHSRLVKRTKPACNDSGIMSSSSVHVSAVRTCFDLLKYSRARHLSSWGIRSRSMYVFSESILARKALSSGSLTETMSMTVPITQLHTRPERSISTVPMNISTPLPGDASSPPKRQSMVW